MKIVPFPFPFLSIVAILAGLTAFVFIDRNLRDDANAAVAAIAICGFLVGRWFWRSRYDG
jgi:hypothetical protein